MRLKCGNCGHEWDYNGQNPYKTNCPHCGYNVFIRKNVVKVEHKKPKVT